MLVTFEIRQEFGALPFLLKRDDPVQRNSAFFLLIANVEDSAEDRRSRRSSHTNATLGALDDAHEHAQRICSQITAEARRSNGTAKGKPARWRRILR